MTLVMIVVVMLYWFYLTCLKVKVVSKEMRFLHKLVFKKV